MGTMNNQTAIAIPAGVWAAGVAAAGVLAYDLNRPLHWGGPGGHFTTPLVGALVAGGWLALISALLWWQRRAQVAHELQLVYTQVRSEFSARMSRRHRAPRRNGVP